MTQAITFPFTLDFFGVLDSTEDLPKIYIDRVLTLISTNVGQIPMNPNYGTNIGAALFENDNYFPGAVKQAIVKAVARWIPEVSVQDVVIESSNQEGVTILKVSLLLPDNTITTINTTTAILNYDGTVANA